MRQSIKGSIIAMETAAALWNYEQAIIFVQD